MGAAGIGDDKASGRRLTRGSVANVREQRAVTLQIDWTPWVRADLFFLHDALAHGMSISEIAGFLGKTDNEVQAKAKELSG